MLRRAVVSVIRAAMNKKAEPDQLLAEAAERLKREAYAAGWRDALAAITTAVQEAGTPALSEGMSLGGEFAGLPRSSTVAGPKQGTTPYVVLQVIRKSPGMTGAQIVSAVSESKHPASEGSIRTSIGRLKGRKLIVARHGKWYAD